MKNMFIPICLILLPRLVFGEDTTNTHLKSKYLESINSSTSAYAAKLTRYSEKALARFSRQENKMRRKLSKIDPSTAQRIFTGSIEHLAAQFKSRVTSKIPGSGYLDTTQLSLQYLKNIGGQNQEAINKALGNLENLQGKLEQTEKIREFLNERRKQLKDELSRYSGFTKDLQKLNKEAYYYREQLSEYKSIYEDPDKAVNKTIELLKRMPGYNDFIARNAQLASLLNLGNNYNVVRSLEGLQLRTQVEQVLQTRVGTAPNGMSAVSEQLNQARDRMNDLKAKFPNLDNASEMPQFKPNPMKTKRWFERLEPGGNIQFQKNNYYFPTLAELAGQIAYRFHKNGSVGIGASYRLGMGEGWNKIQFSRQGTGLRSFLEWKLKATFYINGGFEMNKTANLLNGQAIKNWNGWKSSALIGFNRKQKVGPKLQLNTMILYDFLATYQPQSDKIKIRIGYTY